MGSPLPLEAGVPVSVSPLVRRLLAPNPSLFTGPGTNTWLVGAGPPYTVLDPGPDHEEHLEAILVAAPEVAAIVVTHTHSDHSPGAAALAARTGAPVLGFGAMLRPGVEHHDDTFRADRCLGDGDVVDGHDHRLTAVHTPGHASNHLCFLLSATSPVDGERLLFSGDHVMQGSTVVIAPLDGDMAEYLAQLRRVQGLAADRILPGHGDPIDDPWAAVQAYLDHREAREAKVAAALDELGSATAEEVVAVAYTDVADALRPIAVYSTWAILRKLTAEGRASTDAPDDEEQKTATWTARAG